MTSWTDDDEELWRELRTAVHESDAVDPRHVAAARAAFSWRTVDAELLRLSDAVESDAALVRGSDSAEGRFSLCLGATTSSPNCTCAVKRTLNPPWPQRANINAIANRVSLLNSQRQRKG